MHIDMWNLIKVISYKFSKIIYKFKHKYNTKELL